MKKILFNWYYHRQDLTGYLLEFARDAELVFLYRHFPDEVPGYLKGINNISFVYWSDFVSPGQLLKKVNPNLIVFADLESFNQIALNIAARNKQIPTYVLQHGVRGSFEVEEALALSEEAESNYRLSPTSFWSLRFFLSSLSINNISQFSVLTRFIIDRKKGELTAVLHKHQFELRRADRYIEFSEENTGYHRMRDGVPDNRFILTGNPSFDDYFAFLNQHNAPEDPPFYLLIDCPFTEANFLKDHGITLERKNDYLAKLSAWSASNGGHLKVKLHPLSYHTKGFFQDDSIEYLRDTDLKDIAGRAEAVFFVHFTSLAPIILAYKPAIYFHSVLDSHLAHFRQLGVPVLDLFGFNMNASISETVKKVDEAVLMPYLYKTDGKAAERIRQVLLQQSS
jgi:hypothetical protein